VVPTAQKRNRPVKKVVLLCDFFSSLGGTEKYNAALARGLRAKGIEVRIYVGEKPPLVEWKNELVADGFYFKEPAEFHTDLTSNTIEAEFLDTVIDEINDWQPDIIHVHPFRKMAIQWLTNTRANQNIPIVATEWTVPGQNSAHWFESDTAQHINKVHTYIATCQAIERGLRDYHHYTGNIIAIPHIIESNDVVIQSLPHTPSSLMSVGCISRLSTEKGLVFLIGAWKQIVAQFPDISLHIYGHGPELESLSLLRDCLGLHESITFEGTYKPGDVNSIALRHSIFVQPSLFESIPTSIIELMLAGRVVVTSDVGGIAEIVENDINGMLVESGSTDQIARTIIELVSSPRKIEQLSNRAFTDSSKIYDYTKVMDQIVDLYVDVANKPLIIKSEPLLQSAHLHSETESLHLPSRAA
jgi:glycosyltransferase involved in cell wall biosynthesis